MPDTPPSPAGSGGGIPPWSLPLAALVVAGVVILALQAQRWNLEREQERLESERARLESLLEEDGGVDLEYRCPPVVDLDPGWADRMPWGPGREEALGLLEGGRAEVRILDLQGRPGPTVSWNPELRLYDLASREAVQRRRFWLGVRLSDGSFARTYPTNWPLPPCTPWVDCTEGGCEDGCLRTEGTPEADLPPASLPEPCL